VTRSGAALVLALAVPAASADPATDWMLHCRGCHGADGGGVEGAVPRLAGEVARFLPLPGGREFLVRVPGVAQSELDDARLAALLTWMVTRFGPADLAGDAAPFTAAEVGALRRQPLVDVAGVRERIRTGGAADSDGRAPRRR
jgi:hypothetical protein